MVHGMAFGALRQYCLVPAVYELDLATKHAHSLKCGTLCDRLVLFNVRERNCCRFRFSVLRFPYPARPNSEEDGLEARVGYEGVVKVIA